MLLTSCSVECRERAVADVDALRAQYAETTEQLRAQFSADAELARNARFEDVEKVRSEKNAEIAVGAVCCVYTCPSSHTSAWYICLHTYICCTLLNVLDTACMPTFNGNTGGGNDVNTVKSGCELESNGRTAFEQLSSKVLVLQGRWSYQEARKL